MKRKKVRIITITAIVVIIAGGVSLWLFGGKTSISFNTHVIEEGVIETTVMATGYVQPVEEVEVGTQVSGIIEAIYVDYNSVVKKGDLLARLETYSLQEKVNQAKASLRSSQSDLDYAQQNYDRVDRLYQGGASTRVSYEEAVNRLSQAETSLENAKAGLNQAELNLSYAYIYSPIDGVILERAINPGQTVAASFNTPTLFTIAEDLTKMQVEADVDEADIGEVKEGQPVTFTVDAYPDAIFNGVVSQVRLQPIVTSNVVTYTVIVEAPNPEKKLFPGMTANITIIVASEKGLLVPVEATNFKVTEEIASKSGLMIKPSLERGKKVWIKRDNTLEEIPIETGMGDGIYFISNSGLNRSDEVILSTIMSKNTVGKKGVSLMPRPPGGGAPRR